MRQFARVSFVAESLRVELDAEGDVIVFRSVLDEVAVDALVTKITHIGGF